MNPEDYFQPGSEGYTQTKQALDVINAGREAGLPNMDQYERELEASISLANQSGGKQWKGFDATRQAIAGLAPQINAGAEQRNKVKDAATVAGDTIAWAKGLGVTIDPQQQEMVAGYIESGNLAGLKNATEMIKDSAKSISIGKAKQETGKDQELDAKIRTEAAIQARRIGELADLRGLPAADRNKADVISSLVMENQQRQMIATQARKVMTRLQTATEMLNDKEVMNEFGDMGVTNFFQSSYNDSDQELFRSQLAQLEGGSLGKGMQDTKEATGTAAGMAVEETKALMRSISNLSDTLKPKDAEKSLMKIVYEAKNTLNAMGVDSALHNPEGVRNVMENREKRLFSDEREFFKERDAAERARQERERAIREANRKVNEGAAGRFKNLPL